MRKDGLHTFSKCPGVEVGTEDFVGTVGEIGDTPVAYEGDELPGVGGPHVCAEGLGGVDTGLAFDVDQHELIGATSEDCEGLSMTEGGVNLIAGEAHNLIAQGAKSFARAYVENGGLGTIGTWDAGFHVARLWSSGME